MKIIIPILFVSIAMGLFARRTTRVFWVVLALLIAMVILYNYGKT